MDVRKIVEQVIEENDKWSVEQFCSGQIKQFEYSLRYVKKQTPEICLAAVQQTGEALRYVEKQTPEICAAAVKQNPDAVEYVILPSEPEARKQFIKEFVFYLNQEGLVES